MIFVFHLNRFNFLFFWILSRFWIVKYYTKDEKLSFKDSKQMSIVTDYDDTDDFLSFLEKVFLSMKENLKVELFPKSLMKVDGKTVDFTKASIQKFFIDHQHFISFVYLAKKELKIHNVKRAHFWCADVFFLSSNVIEGFRQDFDQYFVPHRHIHESWNRIRETLTRLVVAIAKTLLRPKVSVSPKINTIISGISESEMHENPYYLKADWWTREGILNADEVLYVTPFFVSKTGFIQENRLYGLFSFSEKLHYLKDILFSLLKSPFKNSYAQFCVQTQIDRIYLWSIILPKLKIKKFITSNSESWPEPAAVLLMNEHGVRTIRWSYSGADYYFSKGLKGFQDLNLWSSLTLVKELWVWDDQLVDLFENRKLDEVLKFSSPIIKKVLTMHCGDFKLLKLSQQELRKIMGVEDNSLFFISIFDARPVKRERRISSGLGPINLLTRQNSFHRDILKILDSHPNIRILYKPKRAKKAFHEDVEMADKLEKHPQVINCDVRLDPLVPILASDLVVTTPMTSPTILAWGYDVKAVYYDPIKTSSYIANPVVLQNLFHDYDTLLSFIEDRMKLPTNPYKTFDSYYIKMIETLKSELD